MSHTPMLNKMHSVQEESQAIGEFLEWLTSAVDEGGRGLVLAQWEGKIERRCEWVQYQRSSGRLLRDEVGYHGLVCRGGKQVKVYRYVDKPDAVTDEPCPAGCDQGYVIEDRANPILVPAQHRGIERLLAEYFKIDLDQAEREKKAILEEIRAL